MGEETLIKCVKTTHTHTHTTHVGGGAAGQSLNHSNTANQCDSNELRAADPISPLSSSLCFAECKKAFNVARSGAKHKHFYRGMKHLSTNQQQSSSLRPRVDAAVSIIFVLHSFATFTVKR